jgi:putative PIN family toxin of toxin-antitoxin system
VKLKPIVVLDSMVIVQALARSTGPAAACLAMIEADAVELLVSNAVLDEWRDVLSRPALLRRFPGITVERVNQTIESISQFGRRLDPPIAPILVDRDPKDQKYLDLAIAGGASFLVTRDRDLLELTSAPQWNSFAPSLQVVDPVSFLRIMAAGSSGP